MATMQLLYYFLLSILVKPGVKAIWPAASYATNGTAIVRLAATFDIAGCALPKDVQKAVDYAKSQILSDTMTPMRLDVNEVERLANSTILKLESLQLSFLQTILSADNYPNQPFQGPLSQLGIVDETNKPVKERDESYGLSIPAGNGSATLIAKTSLGLLRGLQTFTQLVYTTAARQKYIMHAPHFIEDRPAFPMRGFMLDTSRNFYPVGHLKRTLEAASWSKFNLYV